MAIPEDNPPIRNPSVGAAALRVERHALGPLYLVQELDFRFLEQVLSVSLNRDGGPCRHFYLNRLEAGEFGHGAVIERVDGAVHRQEE